MPLYRFEHGPPVRQGADANAGLWHDKFFDKWPQPGPDGRKSKDKDDGEKRAKYEWLEKLAAERIGSAPMLEECMQRRSAMAAMFGVETISVTTEWRFVSGLGRAHPIENGFTWHHPLGVPFLPGSSVKGMVCAWAGCWLDPSERTSIDRIFGPPLPKKPKERAIGSVVFLDAIPLHPVKLECDVMTPHYGPYYRDPDNEVPADWHAPIPILFLVVAAGQQFQFVLLPRRGAPTGKEDCQTAAGWLKRALSESGIGAKTAVGYGRMSEKGAVIRTQKFKTTGPQASRDRSTGSIASIPALPGLGAAGSIVWAVLVEEKTKKGGWKAKVESNSIIGHIANTSDVPGDCKPGDRVQLKIANRTDFRWPSESDLNPTAQSPSPRGPRPRGRR